MNRRFRILILLLSLVLIGRIARADNGYKSEVESWDDFGKYMELRNSNDRVEGVSYMLGGAVLGVVGVAGYQTASDTVARTVFAVSQSAGLLALGYGASLYWSGNEYTSFYAAVEESNLESEQKLELLRNFLKKDRESRKTAQWIRISTLVLTSAVNFYAASQEEDRDLQRAFQVLGGINLALAFQASF